MDFYKHTKFDVLLYSSIKNVLRNREQFSSNKIMDLAAFRTMIKDRASFKPSKSIFVSLLNHIIVKYQIIEFETEQDDRR